MKVLQEKDFHLGAVVLNKVLPSYLLDEEAADTAGIMSVRAEELAKRLEPLVGPPAQVARVLDEMADNFLRFKVVAQRETEQRQELSVTPEVVASVPYFETDIYDLPGLLRLAEQIWSPAPP
jgi:hypothetical protein